MAVNLFRVLLSCFEEPHSRDTVLRLLVQRACSAPSDAASPPASDGEERAQATPPAGLFGAATLLEVLQPHPTCFGPAMQLMVSTAGSAMRQAEAADAQADQVQASKERVVQEQQAAVQRSKTEASGLQRSLEEAQTALRDAQTSHRAGLAAANAGRKDLQDKMGNMERELEWVRGELAEERTAASRRGEDAAGRAREANSAVTRLKSLHREELKRVNKDKQQLSERVQELEAAQARSHGALATARSTAAASAQQQESSAREAGQHINAAQAEIRSLEQQVEQHRTRITEATAAAQASAVKAEEAERKLQQEQARTATLYGANLDALVPAELAALATVYEDGMRRIKALQASRTASQLKQQQQQQQQQQQTQELEDDDSSELTGSLPAAVDLSFMNGHDQPQQHQHQQQRNTDPAVRGPPPPSRASVTSSAESLASIASGPPNGLSSQHAAYASGRSGPAHQGLSNGSTADFMGSHVPTSGAQLARRHSLSHELQPGSNLRSNLGFPAAQGPAASQALRMGSGSSVAPGADRARSPAVGPFFAANGHSAAFAPPPAKDAALPSAFPNGLLNGLGGQGAGAERSSQLW
ncbi:hypothetical protein WJX73_006379 [Symbiochloris irregularis]|uniref:Uncharacterized protein n=1 Tax=Symbiochloris irregularis TaxID=706552 RepID=A0AAW1PX04_9CHLO